MRRCLALIAICAARTAHAEDREDLFGFDKKPAQEPLDCGDARAFGCTTATDPLDDVSPVAVRTWLAGEYLLKLPVANVTHDSVAHYALGASRDEAGPYFAGATGLENRWTIEGAPADSLRTGNVDTRVPLAFIEGILVQAGGFAARDRTSTGGTIDVRLRRGTKTHELDARAWAGYTTHQSTRPIAPGTYQTRRLFIDAGPEATLSLVGTGPLRDEVWYAAGIAPTLLRPLARWRASRLVDANQDGKIDGLPGLVSTERVESTETTPLDYFVPAMVRAGWDRGPHHVELTLIGQASRDQFFLANATQQAAGIDRTALIGDGIATWRGTWKHTRARGQLAWHRSVRRESALDSDAAHQIQLLSVYVPTDLPEDPQLASACRDSGDDPYPSIPNCPVVVGFFASGGAGRLVDAVGDRPTATADLAHETGRHVLRAGATLEDARLVQTTRFTGGALDRSLFPGHLDHQQMLGGSCDPTPGGPCDYASESKLFYRTRYTAAYVEDTFAPVRQLRVDGGLRWELMWAGPSLHFSNELSPRAGIRWDLGFGHAWVSGGRSHLFLPAGLGSTVIARDRTVRDGSFDIGQTRVIDTGPVARVAPGIEPAAQDEITAGLDAAFDRYLDGTVWIQRRSLRRGLDTVLGVPETGELFFDNPGRDGSIPARRESVVMALELAMKPTPQWFVRAGVLWGITSGTWAGPFDPRQGANQLAGVDWDFESNGNLEGALPTDPGKRAFVEGERRGHLAGVAAFASTRLTLSSGRPRNVLGDGDLGLVYLLPRGAGGRGPMISQANVRLGARWHGLDMTLDVFNALDRRSVTNLDEIYAEGSVQPIIGGTLSDLVFLKDDDGTPKLRTTYRLPTAYQSPVGAVLGIQRAF